MAGPRTASNPASLAPLVRHTLSLALLQPSAALRRRMPPTTSGPRVAVRWTDPPTCSFLLSTDVGKTNKSSSSESWSWAGREADDTVPKAYAGNCDAKRSCASSTALMRCLHAGSGVASPGVRQPGWCRPSHGSGVLTVSLLDVLQDLRGRPLPKCWMAAKCHLLPGAALGPRQAGGVSSAMLASASRCQPDTVATLDGTELSKARKRVQPRFDPRRKDPAGPGDSLDLQLQHLCRVGPVSTIDAARPASAFESRRNKVAICSSSVIVTCASFAYAASSSQSYQLLPITNSETATSRSGELPFQLFGPAQGRAT